MHPALLTTLLLAQPPAAPEAVAQPPHDLEAVEQIVVTGRRGSPGPKLSAFDYWQRHCFEANRQTRRSAPPLDDRDWLPVAEDVRTALKLPETGTQAFDLVDEVRGHTLILTIAQLKGDWGLTENRCTLTIVGGSEHETLTGRLNTLFKGPGTERHVGHSAGYDKVPGWRQRLWVGTPNRRSKNWRVYGASGAARSGGSWIIVTDRSFYNMYDYIIGDLKTKTQGRQPVSILSFAYIHSPR